MGKVPIRLKEVVYTLSPFEQSVMSGLWKDLPHKAAHYMETVSSGLHALIMWMPVKLHARWCGFCPSSHSRGSVRHGCRPRMPSFTAACPCTPQRGIARTTRRRRSSTTDTEGPLVATASFLKRSI